MRRFTLAAVLTIAAFGVALSAQKTTETGKGTGGSPHVRSEWAIDGANIAIEYGRPALKGRMPGKDIDPYEGREWRTGADEATTLKTDKALQIGTLAVPAGTYTLYTLPGSRGRLAALAERYDALVALGVEVRDTESGTEWSLG